MTFHYLSEGVGERANWVCDGLGGTADARFDGAEFGQTRWV